MTPKDDKRSLPPVIRDPEHIFSLMMGNLPARVWIKDANGRYVFVNSRLTSELGIDREKWLGSTDEELFPNIGHIYWRKDLQVLTTRAPLVSTDQVEQGKSIFVLRFPLDIDDQTHVAAIGVDTTEHISALIGFFHLRDELFRSERLRSIGEMASGLAHDLKNILHAGTLRLKILRAKAGDHAQLLEDLERDRTVGVGGMGNRLRGLAQELAQAFRVASCFPDGGRCPGGPLRGTRTQPGGHGPRGRCLR